MTDTRDAFALDRILEAEIGIPEPVADTMRLDTSDGIGVTTETTLETALGTIGTEVGKLEATEDTKPPTSDVATGTKLPTDVTTGTKLDTSETNDNGRAA